MEHINSTFVIPKLTVRLLPQNSQRLAYELFRKPFQFVSINSSTRMPCMPYNPPALPVDDLFEDLKQLVHDGLG